MARYEHLPIYRSIFRFCVEITKSINLFSRSNKYSIGQEIKILSYNLLPNLLEANNSYEKLDKLLILRTELEKVIILIRLAFELKAFNSIGNYELILSNISEISKQLEGWISSVKKIGQNL